jgi:serine/threonine-protein kinase
MTERTNIQGKMIGGYEIREVITEGNIIRVYRAYQHRLKRQVAIQTLQARFLEQDRAFREAMTRGAEIIAEFEHPNIVPLLDYIEQDDVPYIVMRMMTGGTLRDRLAGGALSVQECADVVRQIANALDYVHSLGKLHGDPSTGNIVFDSWGSAYISDFLIAGFRNQIKDVYFFGTLEYAAPECIGEGEATHLSDQYSLAAITYDMLTGLPVFVDPNPLNVARMHLYETPQPPQKRRTDIPSAINDVLFWALAKAPAERYPTIMDFAREFEKALNAKPQHLFVSYSRRDKDYAQALKDYMRGNGFTVWIDEQIEHGDHWFNEIHEAIRTCGAFLVVMSPDAETSEWVQKEILLAKRYKKPIFPLLLSGEEFAILIDLQYGDVRGGEMPGADFHRRVSRAVYGTG